MTPDRGSALTRAAGQRHHIARKIISFVLIIEAMDLFAKSRFR
jgi:hypothetical protein